LIEVLRCRASCGGGFSGVAYVSELPGQKMQVGRHIPALQVTVGGVGFRDVVVDVYDGGGGPGVVG
jgi:hypothetical protein